MVGSLRATDAARGFPILDVEAAQLVRETGQDFLFLFSFIPTKFGEEDFAQVFTVWIVLVGHNRFVPVSQRNSI